VCAGSWVGERGQGKSRGVIYIYSVEKEMKVMICEQEFLHTTEYYQQLRE
jgi:hypothetical protein